MSFDAARQDVWKHARGMWEAGLVDGSAGNVSCRVQEHPNLIAITPTAVRYEDLVVDDVAIVDRSTGAAHELSRAPSYELPMHLEIYRALPRVQAIVHTHSPFVTTLSILRRPLPPVIDEMMLYFGGTIEVSEYAFTGLPQVGRNAVAALGDRTAVILANHGNVCVGQTLEQALHLATVMESCARVYVQALHIGEPLPLPAEAIAAGRAMFDARTSGSRTAGSGDPAEPPPSAKPGS